MKLFSKTSVATLRAVLSVDKNTSSQCTGIISNDEHTRTDTRVHVPGLRLVLTFPSMTVLSRLPTFECLAPTDPLGSRV